VLGWLGRLTFARSLAVITAIALGWRIAYVLIFRAHGIREMPTDWYFYQGGANLLASGHGFIQPLLYITGGVEQAADHPPLYMLWLALASVLDPGHWTSPLTHMLWSCIPGAAAVALCGLVGRQVAGPRAGLIAAGIAAVYPYMWMHDGMLLAETMSILTIALVLWASYRFVEAPSALRAAVIGVGCGLAALTRSEMLVLAPLLLVPLALMRRDRSWRARLLMVAAGGAAAAATVAPWIAYNATRFEEPVYMSTNFAVTLAAANCDSTYYGDRIGYKDWDACTVPAYDAAVAKHPDWASFDASQRDAHIRPEVTAYIRDHEKRAVLVAAVRVARIVKVFGVGQELDLDKNLNGQEPWAVNAGLVAWYVVAPLGVAAAVVLRRRQQVPVLPLLVVPAVTMLAAAVTFGQTRYGAPMSPAFVVLAAVAVDAWLRRRRAAEPDAADDGSAHRTDGTDGTAPPTPDADTVVATV
jgi:4-amino-4-deoxy-L-arabinose transferase-like glycosyltransferase